MQNDVNVQFDASVELLKQKGYEVVYARAAEILGENDVKPPMLTVSCPYKKRIRTTPKMWCHFHAREVKRNTLGKSTSCYTIRFSFSDRRILNVEELGDIIKRRYESLYAWTVRLDDLNAPT